MTEVEFIKNLLETNWETSISNRSNDVPEPTFVRQKDNAMERLNTQDVGRVASGGDTDYTPLGFGWTHRQVDTVVAVEYRAAKREVSSGLNDGYRRLIGKRNGANGLQAPDRWSGIVGETQRVLLADRKGRAEWDVIGEGLTVRDREDVGGTNYWRADVIVPLKAVASSIDTSV